MNSWIQNFFKLKENNTDVKTEFIAGLTTFITMAYIIVVNPAILSLTGMDKGSVFTATIVSSVIATLIMGLYANVPFSQAPGMGMNAFFTFTVCIALKIPWQQALAIVFICGVLNFIIVVTNIRKMLIEAIPESLQNAIGGGIGLFIAYIGFKNAHFLNFLTEGYNVVFSSINNGKVGEVVSKDVVPSLTSFSDPLALIALIGLLVIAVLMAFKVKGSILIGILFSTIISIFMGITHFSSFTASSFLPPSLSPTFFKLDIMGLFSHTDKIFEIFSLIFAFSLTDTFDTIGTFIGTGKKAGIFDAKDEETLHTKSGFSSKMDKALFADGIATSIGALIGTSNVTTYVESAAGIGAGGRTGLTSVFTAFFFIVCLFFAPLALIVPGAAAAPALIIVGILMFESIAKVDWNEFEDAAPAFLTIVVMPFSYSISNGIAAGFILFCLLKLLKGKLKEVHPLILIVTVLFIGNFVISAFK